MNNRLREDNWHNAKGKLKRKYGSLTNEDLEYVVGQEEELIGRIQKRTGANRDEIERFFEPDADSFEAFYGAETLRKLLGTLPAPLGSSPIHP